MRSALTRHPHSHDDYLDRNLRRIGRTVPLPDEPTADERGRWPGHAGIAPAASAVPAPRAARRAARFAGLGSALAACLAFVVLMLIPANQPAVGAHAIFASFRQALSNSARITLENIRVEGVTAGGSLLIAGNSSDSDAVDGFAADLHITAADSVEDIGGLDARVAAAFAADQQWVYLRLNKLPDDAADELPLAAMFETMLQNGVLLDLTGLMQSEALREMLTAIGASEVFDADGGHGRASLRTDGKSLSLGVRLGADAQPPGADDPIQQLLEKFVTGTATAEDLAQAAALLEQAAGRVTVTPADNGAFLLEASEFHVPAGETDDADAAMIARLVLRISYQPGEGVRHAELRNVGESEGLVRFEMCDATASDPAFDRSRLIEPGRTMVFQLGQLMNMFGAPGGGE